MNNVSWLVTIAFYTLFSVGAIYYYEDKLHKLQIDYDNLDAEFNWIYTAYSKITQKSDTLQDAMDMINQLDETNETLKAYIDSLKAEITDLRNTMWDYKRTAELAKGGKSEEIQYESSKSHYIYGHTPYVNPYNNPLGNNTNIE